MTDILLPGTILSPDTYTHLTNISKSIPKLHISPGLRLTSSSTIQALTSASLTSTSSTRNTTLNLHPASSSPTYTPSSGDLIIATIHHSSNETYSCQLTPFTPLALLPYLSFENATRKTRPQLNPGDVVYARVRPLSTSGAEVELECCDVDNTGKADGLGQLKNGMVVDVSTGLARRMLLPDGKGGMVVLEELGKMVRFEIAVGRNGKVWVDAPAGVRETVAVVRAIKEVDAGSKIREDGDGDEGGKRAMGEEEQRKVAKRILRELGLLKS